MSDVGRLFGTDGVRGKANVHPMTAEMALALGRAIAHVFRQRGENGRFRVIIGKDTRRSGYMFESALTSGICSMGGDVLQVGPMPTPGMAFLTTDMRCDAGVMISASHNPYEDNGIKFFSSDGFKLPDKIEDEIERLISSRELEKTGASADRVGRARRLDDVLGRYVVFLKKTFPRDLTLDGLRVVVDCANGAAYKVAPTVLGELGAEVFTAGVDPDGYNINAGVGSLYPDTVAAKVREVRAEVGIALDGDADRCVLIDENGSIVDGDQILAICARDMQERGVLKGAGVVATVMSNIGLERSLAEVDLSLIRCKVGDRYVVEGMREGGFNLGGEQSGHTIFLDENTTGDGTMSALRVLAIMKKKGRRLSELASVMTRYPQAIRNVRVARKPALESIPKLRDAVKQAEADLRGTGRVLFRYSGTEPKARVMVEGEDAARIERLADDLAALANEQLSDAS